MAAESKFIRPMNIFQVFGSVITLYLRNFLPFFGINLIIFLPSLFLWGVFVGPITIAASNAILGKPVKVGESFRQGLSKKAVGSLVVMLVVVYIVIAAFVIAFYNSENSVIIPSLIVLYLVLGPLFVFYPIVILLEKRGIMPALTRTFQLYFANFLRILAILVLIGAGFLVLSLIPYWYVLLFIINPAMTLLFVLTYYEYRARKENYTESTLTQELGFAPLDEMMTM